MTADTEDLPFFLFVELAPRALGFAFDPTAIRVTRIGGIPMSPVAYAGPGRTSGQRCVEPTSGKDRLPRSVEARSFTLTPAEEPTCFAVLFGKQLFSHHPVRARSRRTDTSGGAGDRANDRA